MVVPTNSTQTSQRSMDATIADHWATGDVYARIVAALGQMSKPLDAVTVQDLEPVDHLHARGVRATAELADRLPIEPHHHVLDIGCGLGGPARYLADRFRCRVTGVDITRPFVEAARKLTCLVGMEDHVTIEYGNGHDLPYGDEVFDGAYSQHVTMNVADRGLFFAEAARVLKRGGFFALTEHGLGPAGAPRHPVPWSDDGRGAYLVLPEETRALLEAAGFTEIVVEETGAKYLKALRRAIEVAEQGALPPLGTHLVTGARPEKLRNAARNIEEGRTRPVQVFCRKPS